MFENNLLTRFVSCSVRSCVICPSPKLASSRLRQRLFGRQHRKPHDGSLAIVSTICFRIIMAVLIYIPHAPQISHILFAHSKI